jgi:anaerobic selenocysteine-containing dehydrogenase
MRTHGVDPLPDYIPPAEFASAPNHSALILLTGAAHHFVSSSFGNQPKLAAKEGIPFIELNPTDAISRGIANGQDVIVENDRGWCQLRAHVTEDVAPGVAVAPKGFWGRRSPGGRNVNWLTSDALADLGGQATFHSNLVTVRAAVEQSPTLELTALAAADD